MSLQPDTTFRDASLLEANAAAADEREANVELAEAELLLQMCSDAESIGGAIGNVYERMQPAEYGGLNLLLIRDPEGYGRRLRELVVAELDREAKDRAPALAKRIAQRQAEDEALGRYIDSLGDEP